MATERRVGLMALLDRVRPQPVVDGDPNVSVMTIETDSRKVRAGSLFVALRGSRTDGHRYIEQAIRSGARAVITEEPVPPELHAEVTVVRVADSRRALSAVAAAYYGDPSLSCDVIGVTGTNGKTTTTHMVAAILNACAIPCGILGTVGAQFESHARRLQNTTPLALELHALLAEMRKEGAKAVAMEVSSHALALDRVDDVRFRIGVLTNIGRDHLDFHETIESYAAAKRRLFELAPIGVLNLDDPYGRVWAMELSRAGRRVTSYGTAHDAGIVPRDIVTEADGTRFRVNGQRFELRLPGRFNVWNALAAIGVARMLGIEDAHSARGLRELERVAGRMERYAAGGIAVVIDYAHTPDALESALRALRETAPGALTVVFGCGGDRDRGKRPEMGAVAARLADRVYVTTDNPRSEDPQTIADAILAGITGSKPFVELDRRRAIERAIGEARSGDVVLVAGKGHEDYQIVGDRVLPLDDAAVARDALAARSVFR